MAGKALAAFFLLATFLQVRAQVDCYTVAGCPAADATKYEATTESECCLDGLPGTRSYSPVGDATGCTECIVIGFSTNNLTLDEESEQIRTIKVVPLTSASNTVRNSMVTVTIEVFPSGSDAILGSDLKVNDGMQKTIEYMELLALLNEDLKLQTLNDDNTGEMDEFVLKVTQLELVNQESGQTLVAFPGAQLNVTIIDDDIIHVEFEVTEYQLNEDRENLTVTFKVSNSIPGPTHFIVRPMTYQDYDDEYLNLVAKYPDIKPYSLSDEYDQAEATDFNSTTIPFTIPANSVELDRPVTIKIILDDLLEPAEEGFRLVLEVDESKGTRLSEVTFGRQLALCRIDNTDPIEFGFQDAALTFTDTLGTQDLELPLRVVSGKTEFPIILTFAIGDRTNATEGRDKDFVDFTSAKLVIVHPMDITPQGFLEVQVNGDNVFEGDELIEVILEYDLDLPAPFRPQHVDSPEYGSVVDEPPTGSISIDRKITEIIIKEGVTNNTARLIVPTTIEEGGSFYPNITVLHIVNATFYVFISSGGSTAQRNQDYTFSGQDVVFDPTGTTFHTSSPVNVIDDDLVEPDETIVVRFQATSPPGIEDWMHLINKEATVTIKDQDSATIGFEDLSKSYEEPDGPAVLNVMVKGDQLAANAEVVVRFYTSPGTAQVVTDFEAVDRELTFTGAQQTIAVEIPIIDDTIYEKPSPETFQAHLQLVSSNVNAAVESAPATVSIHDNEPQPVKDCTLSSDLILETFSNEVQMGREFNISMGCERKLVTSCDPNVDLEIRVDFFKDNFDSTKVAIFYEGEEVIMDESFNLIPATEPSSDFVFTKGMMSASVSISDIGLTVTLTHTQLTISTDNTTLDLAGLCGNINGEFVYPDCTDIFGSEDSEDEFIHSFKVKPSDQVLRGERKECGLTANDTIISDPLMTVPIHVPGLSSDLNLCYEIHGAEGKYFNLVSDECTSVNAHYASAAPGSKLNIIDSISVVAVDTTGKCHNITVDASNNSVKRRRRAATSELDENGVSVRYYDSRARISVPNCEDNELVMWVVCQTQSLYDEERAVTIEGVEMIKFEIARGLNLKETSHGLLGQFWNIPISVTPYNGPFVYPVDDADMDKYYTVEVSHPMSPVRSFVGYMFDVTWEWKHKHCVYAGDRQGGPAGEVASDGSVIQGTYNDYVIATRYGTQFKYGVFEEDRCM